MAADIIPSSSTSTEACWLPTISRFQHRDTEPQSRREEEEMLISPFLLCASASLCLRVKSKTISQQLQLHSHAHAPRHRLLPIHCPLFPVHGISPNDRNDRRHREA